MDDFDLILYTAAIFYAGICVGYLFGVQKIVIKN